MITLDQECEHRKKIIYNVDYMTERYITSNSYFEFPDPNLWTLEKNLFYLIRNSVIKNFEQKYIMRPTYLSYDEYGTVILDKLLMRVNSIFCVEDFSLDKVIIPDYDAILKICDDRFPHRSNEVLSEVNY